MSSLSCSIEIVHSFVVWWIFAITWRHCEFYWLFSAPYISKQASGKEEMDSHLQLMSHYFENIVLHFSFFSSCVLFRVRLQNFLFKNLTIVVSGLPLPILWHSLIWLFSTVKFIALYLSSPLSSRWLSDTVARISWILMLFLLVYWSSLFLERSSSIIFSSTESNSGF